MTLGLGLKSNMIPSTSTSVQIVPGAVIPPLLGSRFLVEVHAPLTMSCPRKYIAYGLLTCRAHANPMSFFAICSTLYPDSSAYS